MRRVLAVALAAIVLAGATSYEDMKLHGQVMTNQVNKWRSPDIYHMYLLSKVADRRAQERLDEFLETGTAEFPHTLQPVYAALWDAGICYRYVGEAVGFSFRDLAGLNPSQIANYLTDLWYASDSHRSMLADSAYNRGGGGWVTDPETNATFFAYYVLDPC